MAVRICVGSSLSIVRAAAANQIKNFKAVTGLVIDGQCPINNITRRTMSSEEEKAKTASIPGAGEKTIFQKILDKEIPCQFLHEDDLCVAFDDVAPQAPVHFLVIPKKPVATVEKATEEDEKTLGHLMVVASKVAKEQKNLDNGFRLVVNNGKEGCQSVYHLHVHCIGGKQLSWPPGC